MRRNGIKLSTRHRAWLYGTFAVLFATGVVWWALHRFGRVEGDFGPTVNPLEPWLLKLHGAAAMVSLLVLGTLIPLHLKRGWHARRNRGSGGGMVALCVLLIVTGYALYYVGGDQLRELASTAHLVLGFGFPAALIWHIVRGRRTTRQSNVPPPQIHPPRTPR